MYTIIRYRLLRHLFREEAAAYPKFRDGRILLRDLETGLVGLIHGVMKTSKTKPTDWQFLHDQKQLIPHVR